MAPINPTAAEWLAEWLLFWLGKPFRGVEWSENPRAFPHCCGQGGCWMHVDEPWCRCFCRWCRIARRVR